MQVSTSVSLFPSAMKIFVGAMFIAGLLGGVFYKGYQRGHAKAELELAQFKAQVQKKELDISKQQVAINSATADKAAAKIDTIKVRAVHYVHDTAEVPGPTVFVHDTTVRVELPIGWVSLHNASASNSLPDTASLTDATPSGITPNTALGYIVENYATCHENAVRLDALQEWVRQTQRNVEKKGKR